MSESGGTLVTGVTLSKTDLSLAVGGYETLSATVAPEDATTTSLTWASDDPSVATVAEGMVRGVKAGSTVIRVTTTDQGKTATCTVTVGSTVSGGRAGQDHAQPRRGRQRQPRRDGRPG